MNDKIIAVYIRLSLEDTDVNTKKDKKESDSIGNQRKYIQDYIKKNNFPQERVQEFVDDGYSGTNFNRPKIQELLEFCKQGKVECIIVKDFSRFGRSYIELGDYLEQLFPFLGVRFISINDHYDSSNLNGDTGGIDVAFQNLVYELYSRDISKKLYSSVGNLMKKGTFLPGSAPFGYKNDKKQKKLIPDEEAAKIVKRIFDEVANGKLAAQVAKEFNQEGVPIPLEYKKQGNKQLNHSNIVSLWTTQRLHNIIRNEKYMGTMVYRTRKRVSVGSKKTIKQEERNWIRIENHHEPIVEKEVFKKANASFKKVKRSKKMYGETKKSLFVCGYCRHRLTPRYSKVPYIKCANAFYSKDENCSNVSAIINEVYAAIGDEIRKRKQEMQDTIETGHSKLEIEAGMLKKRLEQIHAELQMVAEKGFLLYQIYKNGSLDKTDFLEQKQVLEKERQHLSEAEAEIGMKLLDTQRNQEALTLPDLKSYEKTENLEDLIREWVKEIIVFAGNQMEIVWQDAKII